MITILTTTYNRENLLDRLYESLKNQINKKFIWYIVDDGSSDNTKAHIRKYIDEKKIEIRYDYKENAGKHKAINYAIKNIKTDLTFIVDSDDWLEESAIDEIYFYDNKYKNDNTLCGYSFLRKYPNGHINNKKFPKDELRGNYIQVRINGKIGGDKAEVWKTKCLKEYPFPEFQGENFLGEDIVWIDMAEKYEMIHINKAIYISDYLEEGLTKNRRINNIKSPNGCVERAKRLMNKNCNAKTKLKGAMQYIIYSKFAKRKIEFNENKIVYAVYPISVIIYRIWKKVYKN